MALHRTLPNPPVAAPQLTVYFDGACPVCRREVAVYRRQPGADACAWVDAAACDDAALGPGLARPQALAKLHVRLPDGRLVAGAPGFAALWSALPRWRWLGRLAGWAAVRPLAALAYAVFLRLRPLWRAQPSPAASDLPAQVVSDLRSDHAGEAGAVQIYRAIAALSRDAGCRAMALRHGEAEAAHLRLIEGWLPPVQRSRLLPAWRVAGWLTGALPALCGPRAVAATIAAVEQFVDHHYAEQLARMAALPAHPQLPLLRRELAGCHADELAHRDEALALQGSAPLPAWLRGWTWLVGTGSAAAVALARRW
jgi:demethoxyubiquinone hydroxylase (CLK1/Coq7/Cat5 family)